MQDLPLLVELLLLLELEFQIVPSLLELSVLVGDETLMKTHVQIVPAAKAIHLFPQGLNPRGVVDGIGMPVIGTLREGIATLTGLADNCEEYRQRDYGFRKLRYHTLSHFGVSDKGAVQIGQLGERLPQNVIRVRADCQGWPWLAIIKSHDAPARFIALSIVHEGACNRKKCATVLWRILNGTEVSNSERRAEVDSAPPISSNKSLASSSHTASAFGGLE